MVLTKMHVSIRDVKRLNFYLSEKMFCSLPILLFRILLLVPLNFN